MNTTKYCTTRYCTFSTPAMFETLAAQYQAVHNWVKQETNFERFVQIILSVKTNGGAAMAHASSSTVNVTVC